MNTSIFDHLLVLAAGKDSETMMQGLCGIDPETGDYKYDKMFVKYRFKDAPALKNIILDQLRQTIDAYKEHIDGTGADENKSSKEMIIHHMEESYKRKSDMTPEQVFDELEPELPRNPETGDIMEFTGGGYPIESYEEGGRLSNPFYLKDGTTAYKAKKGDIDFDLMATVNRSYLECLWDFSHGLRKPETHEEKELHKRCAGRPSMFERYDSRESFILLNTVTWFYAFVDGSGWKDVDQSGMNLEEWASGFKKRFLDDLPEDTELTIYECRRFKQDLS